jgi:transcriptional regulator with XRE-family HTH domain
MHLADNLTLIRKLTGTTQPEFGSLFNATKAMIVSYEKGKASPDDLFLSRLSDRIGITEVDIRRKRLSEKDIKVEKLDSFTAEILEKAGRTKLKVVAEGKSDVEAMFAALLKEKERVIAEKEARRIDAVARLQKSDDLNDKLLSLLQTNLNRLQKDQDVILAYQKAWVALHAEEVANGNESQKNKIMAKMGRLVGEFQHGPIPTDKT